MAEKSQEEKDWDNANALLRLVSERDRLLVEVEILRSIAVRLASVMERFADNYEEMGKALEQLVELQKQKKAE